MIKPVFNGHTWIVAIIAILCLTALGIYAEIELFQAFSNGASSETLKLVEICGIGLIPKSVVIGIEFVIKRLTYVPDIGKGV